MAGLIQNIIIGMLLFGVATLAITNFLNEASRGAGSNVTYTTLSQFNKTTVIMSFAANMSSKIRNGTDTNWGNVASVIVTGGFGFVSLLVDTVPNMFMDVISNALGYFNLNKDVIEMVKAVVLIAILFAVAYALLGRKI